MSQLSTPPPQQDELFTYISGVFAVRFDEDGTPFRRANPDMIANMLRNDHGYFASDTALFWRAQLAHYGFPSASDTRDAKRCLQRAIRRGSLRVPQAVSDIEIRLKQRWEAENIKDPRESDMDDEDTNDLAAAPSETVEADISQRIAESMERPPSRANATTNEELGYSGDMQNIYRDPGATLWLATTDQPFPGSNYPLTGNYMCTTTKGLEVPDGTLTLSHDPNCSTWWVHFRISFLEGPSGSGCGHIRSYYGMGLIPRGPQEDGKFWRQPLFSAFKLRTLQACRVNTRVGEITFDWRRSALTE